MPSFSALGGELIQHGACMLTGGATSRNARSGTRNLGPAVPLVRELGTVPNADTTFTRRTFFASSSVPDNVWPMTRPVFVHRTVAIGDTVDNRDTIEHTAGLNPALEVSARAILKTPVSDRGRLGGRTQFAVA